MSYSEAVLREEVPAPCRCLLPASHHHFTNLLVVSATRGIVPLVVNGKLEIKKDFEWSSPDGVGVIDGLEMHTQG